jgi:ComF family protein
LNIRTIVNQLFPQRCLLCQSADGPLCEACRADLPWLPAARCPVCALPTPGGDTCGHCLKDAPAFDRTHAPFAYAFPVDALIQRLKYAETLVIAPLLGSLLAERVEHAPDAWLPMPLHARRLKERGFNQAVEIARELSRRSGIAMQPGWATRQRDTPPQAGLRREARRKNLRGAFACRPEVRGLHIGIVDDVMTTGSTLNALAETLKQAGATEVSCLVVARA